MPMPQRGPGGTWTPSAVTTTTWPPKVRGGATARSPFPIIATRSRSPPETAYRRPRSFDGATQQTVAAADPVGLRRPTALARSRGTGQAGNTEDGRESVFRAGPISANGVGSCPTYDRA